MIHTITADERAAGVRLDIFLTQNNLTESRSQAKKLIASGLITVQGTSVKPSYLVQPKDIITITIIDTQSASTTIAPELPIIYEDADILIINKPPYLVTHPGSGTKNNATVADFARKHTSDPDPERPGIVHRLDQDTSGLLIIAKTPTSKTYYQDQFRQHLVQKTYTLLISGHLEPAEAIIKLPLDRDPSNPLRRAVVGGGRPAITRYRAQAYYPGYTLVEAYPQTGRTHQLRVHFAALGHPIAGDTAYGATHTSAIKVPRLFLHASRLKFTSQHHKTLDITCPLPSDLQQVLNLLEAK